MQTHHERVLKAAGAVNYVLYTAIGWKTEAAIKRCYVKKMFFQN